jgi:hypothetical protein
MNDKPSDGLDHVAEAPTPPASEETLVADSRAGLTPSQLVERKLAALLSATPIPVSHLQLNRLTRR